MKSLFFFVVAAAIFTSCGENHFISDSSYRDKVIEKFNARKEMAVNRADKLFGVLDSGISAEEKEALQFLYAYMPLCDLADYDGNFFLKQVRAAFEARRFFTWGSSIPEEIFRHFVLPYRVNNENLDTARIVFFDELKDRIKNLSMYEAALEVNHWCHEKVNYHSTDIRTSGPLSTVRTSWGRCGEESTFTVTALRAVGIPARQVYTPRWAHCDDNHAWVEVWVDGKWYYLGACEPEPKLNMGWFTEPARRAMLVHTKVFGDYDGSEEVTVKTDNYTEINVLSNYADVKKIFVHVINQNYTNADSADIEFGLYNYAEFYPLAKKITDVNGICYLTTGLGDLLIWANKNGKFGMRKITVAEQDTVRIILSEFSSISVDSDYDFIPPVEKIPYPSVDNLAESNKIRLAFEDSVRAAYRDTFIDSTEVLKFASDKNIDANETWLFVKSSCGNWKEILSFIEKADESQYKSVFGLLNNISEKDLRDVPSAVLLDHLENTLINFSPENFESEKIFNEYVLNPRIINELVVPYRKLFYDNFKMIMDTNRASSVMNIIEWINKNITINETDNYYNLPVTPAGVFELKISNKESRDIFFTAIARSLGIPARLEPSLLIPQYFSAGKWLNVSFDNTEQIQPETGFLELTPQYDASKIDPHYFIHFTIGRLDDGAFKSLEFQWEQSFSEFPKPILLEIGKYRLITGNRNFDGSVMTRISFFEIEKNKTSIVPFKVRDTKTKPLVYGRIEINNKLAADGREKTLSDYFNKDKLIIGWINPGAEPTKHFIADLKSHRGKFEQWGGNVILIHKDESIKTIPDLTADLPSTVKLAVDKNDILKSVMQALNLKSDIQFPLLIVLNYKGEIIMYSSGYKIGIGEQLLKTVL